MGRELVHRVLIQKHRKTARTVRPISTQTIESVADHYGDSKGRYTELGMELVEPAANTKTPTKRSTYLQLVDLELK